MDQIHSCGLTAARFPTTAFLRALWCLTLAAVAVGWLQADMIRQSWPRSQQYSLAAGLVVGFLVSVLQQHPRRRMCWVPVGALGLAAGLVLWLAAGLTWSVAALVGVSAGALLTAQRATGLDAGSAVDGPTRPSWRGSFLPAFALASGWGAGVLRWEGVISGEAPVACLAALSAGTFIVSLWVYRRPCFEQLLELLIWPMYRVRAAGPGVAAFPPAGPVLVIANHAAYLDPFWVMKVLPRELTPMMISRYFDLPVAHWLMTHVVRAIRVEWSFYRHDAPELEEAVARLDRGEGVLIFPEGWVRRTEEVPVRRFGQGVWRILRERPATPVVACWIDGGWGSLASYWNGPPFRNKRMDWWRPIGVGVAAPVVLDAAMLADQHATRERLRGMCVDARRYLGLAAIDQGEGT